MSISFSNDFYNVEGVSNLLILHEIWVEKVMFCLIVLLNILLERVLDEEVKEQGLRELPKSSKHLLINFHYFV